MSDPTNPSPVQDPETGRFLSGNNGGGRTVGSRNKLGEEFLADLLAAWKANGKEAITRVLSERPQDFLKVVASILPKEIVGEVRHRYVVRAPMPAKTVDEWLTRVKETLGNGATIPDPALTNHEPPPIKSLSEPRH